MDQQQKKTSPSNTPPTTNSDALLGRIIKGRYQIGDFVAGGAYGRFHLGTDQQTGKTIGVKLEKKSIEQPQLYLEFGFYIALGNIRFIPKIFLLSYIDDWNALVMEVLGPSLFRMQQTCDGFTLQTTTQLMIQVLNIFEYVHEHGIIYRDIKPDNFMLGPPNSDKWATVCLIDLGFCKKYLNDDNTHIDFRLGKPIAGTPRYISVNNHAGRELSRRDDLEAALYMIVFLHKGQLPWQGVTAADIRKKYNLIGAMKHEMKASELCSSMPQEYAAFLDYVRGLEFQQRPAYQRWKATFRTVLTKLGASLENAEYDWDQAHVPKPQVKESSKTPSE